MLSSFEQTAESGFYKTMGDKLRAHSKSRCNSTRQCVELVKSLPAQYVYLDVNDHLFLSLTLEHASFK
jgi:hypothetical protein